MVIDIHGHVSAPLALYAYQAQLIASRGFHGKGKLQASDDEIVEAAVNHVALLGRMISTIALFSFLRAGGGCKGEPAASQPPGQAGRPPAVVWAEIIRKTVPVYGEYVAQTVANSSVDIQASVEATLDNVLFVEASRRP